MSEHQEYPHMLYRDGKVCDDYMIVGDPGEEAAAKKQGYARAGDKKPVKQAD